jgi:Tol biopolymer transport system component
MIASCILTSCDMPTKGNQQHDWYSTINIVSIDGSGHRVILDDQSYNLNLLPTKSGIFYDHGNFSLYTINYDGSNQRRLYPNLSWVDRYFTLDESKILLTSGVIENNQFQNNLYLMNSDMSDLVPLAPQKGQYLYSHISPNLDEIVFNRGGSIATINVDGTDLQYIRTKTDSTQCTYVLYVDQDHILYFEQSNDIVSMRLFDKTNRQDRLIGTRPPGWPWNGRVLVNGKLLYNDLVMIKVLDINTSRISSLCQGYYASYSKDGSRIVYLDFHAHSICMMNGDGSNQQTIYTEQDQSKSPGSPQFSADEKFIIFTTEYSVVAP